MSKNKTGSIEEALQLLDNLAHDHSEDIESLLSKGFDHLNGFLRDAKLGERFTSAKAHSSHKIEQAEEMAKLGRNKIENRIQSNPWLAVGAAAIGGVFLGWMISRKS
jgi:ElaB/YqjD/DUF883 family membrane-anchored ribosome-binding protein